mgnify:CR=1 FL=1
MLRRLTCAVLLVPIAVICLLSALVMWLWGWRWCESPEELR